MSVRNATSKVSTGPNRVTKDIAHLSQFKQSKESLFDKDPSSNSVVPQIQTNTLSGKESV